MEQRWTARTDVRLNVDLHYKDLEVVNCQTRDVSFGGAYIEIMHPRPAVDTPLDLIFRLGEREEYTKYRVPAKVVRDDHDGVGIMFKDFDVSSFRSLREVLRQKDAEA